MKKLIVVAAAVMAGAVVAGEFKAGFARVDITPPLGSYMPGYYQERRAKEVLDPLQINMVAFSDGKTTALLAQYDTEAISDPVADMMRDAIVKATGVARDAILLHASHTHDGAFLCAQAGQGSNALADARMSDVDRIYIDMAVTRSADAAVEAIRDLKPARLACAETEAKRISFVRRYLMKDGKVRTNPGTNNPDVVKPVGSADESVRVLRVDREGGRPICIINFQTHPDVVGGETITADWPGLTRSVFEAATFGEALCMVVNGTQGDVNHCNVIPRPGELNGLKRDFDAVDRGYEHAWHMANVLASAALSKWMKCAPLEAGEIRCATSMVRVPAHKARETDEKNLAWAEDVWALHEKAKKDGVVATPKDYVTAKYGWVDMELTTEVARAGRIRRMASHADYHDLPIYSFSIGKSVAFGGFPGEPFNEIGVAVRKASPFRLTILSCLTNGSRGYFPFSSSFKEDGYEAATSPFGPSVADDLIRGETELLGKLHR